MIKRIGVLILVIIQIFSVFSYASEVDFYGGYPYAESSLYEDSKMEINFGAPIETFSSSIFSVYEWDKPLARKEVREFIAGEDSVEVRVTSLKAGKLYVLESKYLRVDGVYKNSYKQLFRVCEKSGGYGLSIIDGRVFDDKTFEIYFNQPVSATSELLTHMRLYQDGELIAGDGIGVFSIVRTIPLETRVLCKLTGATTFDEGHEYRLDVTEGFESDYGTEISDLSLSFYLYRLPEFETIDNDISIEKLSERTLKIIFEDEMSSQAAPVVQLTQNRAVPVQSYSWHLDDEERQKILIVTTTEEIPADKQVLISGVSKLYSSNKIISMGRVVQSDSTVLIEEVQVVDPATLKVTMNQPLTNEGIKELNVALDRLSTIAVKAVDLDNPYVLHLGLNSRKSIVRSSNYFLQLSGEISDSYGVNYAVDTQFEFSSEAVNRYNFKINTAYFIDESNILLKLSHPIRTESDIEDKLKVVQDNSDSKQRIGIESIEIEDPFTVRINLVKESNMYDVVVKAEDIYDASGRFELDGTYKVSGPWD